jgi:hypothetical protein
VPRLPAATLGALTESDVTAKPPLSLCDLLLVLGVSLVTSKGAHGMPGSAIVILAATLNAVPSIPAIGLVLVLVLSVDWFIRMALPRRRAVFVSAVAPAMAPRRIPRWSPHPRRTML